MSSGRVDIIHVTLNGNVVETKSIVGVVGLRKLIKILQVNLKILEEYEVEDREHVEKASIPQPEDNK